MPLNWIWNKERERGGRNLLGLLGLPGLSGVPGFPGLHGFLPTVLSLDVLVELDELDELLVEEVSPSLSSFLRLLIISSSFPRRWRRLSRSPNDISLSPLAIALKAAAFISSLVSPFLPGFDGCFFLSLSQGFECPGFWGLLCLGGFPSLPLPFLQGLEGPGFGGLSGGPPLSQGLGGTGWEHFLSFSHGFAGLVRGGAWETPGSADGHGDAHPKVPSII